MESLFDQLQLLPPDPILGLAPLFSKDPRKEKVNLGIGTYKDEKGYSTVFNAVRQAELAIDQAQLDKEYQPIDGSTDFKDAIMELVFGSKAAEIRERTAVTASIGGSGSLRLAADLLNVIGIDTAALPDPTWSNHFGLLKNLPNLIKYPYYNVQTHTLDFTMLLKGLESLPKRSFVLFHTCCQNPTGADLTIDQWKALIPVMKKGNLYPLFDFAYHGYKEGIEEDRMPIHIFLEHGFEMLICYSLSKSLTLYGERVGAFIAVCGSALAKEKMVSQIKVLIRHNYSSSPLHGTRIVPKIIFTKELRESWQNELSKVKNRVKEMRSLFVEKIPLPHILSQNGLFSLLGLSKEQVMELRDHYGIYMPENGRINFAGLNMGNIDYTVKALKEVFSKDRS